MLISCPRENLVFLPFLLLDYRLYWHEWFQHRKSDNQHIIGTIYISYWHGSNLIESVTQTSRIIVVICFKRNDFKKSKVSSKDSSVKYFAMFFFFKSCFFLFIIFCFKTWTIWPKKTVQDKLYLRFLRKIVLSDLYSFFDRRIDPRLVSTTPIYQKRLNIATKTLKRFKTQQHLKLNCKTEHWKHYPLSINLNIVHPMEKRNRYHVIVQSSETICNFLMHFPYNQV